MLGDAFHEQSGHAALHTAAVKGHRHLAQLLCKVGVDASGPLLPYSSTMGSRKNRNLEAIYD